MKKIGEDGQFVIYKDFKKGITYCVKKLPEDLKKKWNSKK